MPTKELLVAFLTATFVIGTPFYIYFRQRMISGPPKTYSRRRIIKLILVNLFMNLMLAGLFTLLLGSVLISTPRVDNFTYFGIGIYVLLLSLAFYGSGMYIASIIVENYIPRKLENERSFELPNSTLTLFHRPLSHFISYSSWQLIILVLVLLDGLSLPTNFFIMPLIGLGIVGGIACAIMTLYSSTWTYQLLVGFLILDAVMIVFAGGYQFLNRGPLFFWGVSLDLAFLTTFVNYIVMKKLGWIGRLEKTRWICWLMSSF